MAQYVMVLRRATSLRGALEGVGPEIKTFLCPDMATSEASSIWVPKSRDFQGLPLPMPRVMMLHASKPFSFKCHINNRYIGNFMYTGVVALLCVVVCRYVGILAAV
jgi:hypothetical protein